MLEIDEIEAPGYEAVLRVVDQMVGMEGFIAVHSTRLGPSLGGLRIRSYRDADAAMEDVLDLSEAMTHKSAAAGLPFGGGKAVVMGDPSEVKSDPLLEQFGHAVNHLEGTYITAEDVGTTVADLAKVALVTRWVAGLPSESGGSGDPSPATAVGVLMAMRAVALHEWGEEHLEGRRVLVQGLGKVGMELVRLLCDAGAEVLVADVARDRVEMATTRHQQVQPVAAVGCHTREVDIFAPCAFGGVLTGDTIRELRCRAVVGSANNQLANPEAAADLAERGIVYAPDFITNAGGIINIASEYGYTESDVETALRQIGHTTRQVLEAAAELGITTLEAAMAIARRRLTEAARS